MSGRPAPTTKLGLRDRIRYHIRSSLAPPSPQSTNLSLASTSSPILATADPANTTTGHPVSEQDTSQPYNRHNILSQALRSLLKGDRTVLQDYIPSHASDVTLALQQALTAIQEKQRHCDEKRWKFMLNGRSISLKEEADKVILWLDRFKAVGDVAVNADPVHAGLPWAGIRLLLEV